MTYGLPAGSNITYGSPASRPGYAPPGVQPAGQHLPGHQESQRAEAGFAPNPQLLNRGIDWAGSVPDMQRFAEYPLSIKGSLEQVIWENPNTGQRVGVAGGDDVTTAPYYADDYGNHTDHVHAAIRADTTTRRCCSRGRSASRLQRVRRVELEQPGPRRNQDRPVPSAHPGRPRERRQPRTILANPANQVSYHYTVSEDPRDHGVTVCDVVDTDDASWSVLSANKPQHQPVLRRVVSELDPAQWLAQSRAIDVAAYLAVQDCPHGIPLTVIARPTRTGARGSPTTNYVTKVLGDGPHDVGPNFPWDVFAVGLRSHQPGRTGDAASASASASAEADSRARARHQHRRRFPPRRPAPNWVAGLSATNPPWPRCSPSPRRRHRARLVLAQIEAVNPAACNSSSPTRKADR